MSCKKKEVFSEAASLMLSSVFIENN